MSKGLEIWNKFLGSKGISNEEFDKIEKELKALEIIKRGYDNGDLQYDDTTNTYYYLGEEITKEEYDLLWEIFVCH